MEHLVSIDDLDDDEMHAILDRAARFEADLQGAHGTLPGRIVCTAFFEPSTRTRLSFDTAIQRLGAHRIGFDDGASTSTAKGESLADSIRVLAGYADAIVLRHPEAGAAREAARSSRVPVINAGDGAGEHPTQALLDLYTIKKHYGRLEGLRVALIGDLRYGRTVHSLAPALRRAGASVDQVPAPGLEYPGDLPAVAMEEAVAAADVLYVTRVQRERFASPAAYGRAQGALRIDRALLETAGFEGIVMHPLPRVDELAADVDEHPSAKYFDQAQNGVAVRMAVLATLLEDP